MSVRRDDLVWSSRALAATTMIMTLMNLV